MIGKLAVDHFARGFVDRVGEVGVECAQFPVHTGRRLLDDAERAHHGGRHGLGADLEVHEAALGLSAPVSIGCDVDRTEGVALGTGRLL